MARIVVLPTGPSAASSVCHVVVAGCCALIIGIIALVRSRQYLAGKGRLGLAIVGVLLGGLEVAIFALTAAVLVVVALNP